MEYRSKAIDERGPSDIDFDFAFDGLIEELNSPELIDTLETIEIPPLEIIKESNLQIQSSVVAKVEPSNIKINELLVSVCPGSI